MKQRRQQAQHNEPKNPEERLHQETLHHERRSLGQHRKNPFFWQRILRHVFKSINPQTNEPNFPGFFEDDASRRK